MTGEENQREMGFWTAREVMFASNVIKMAQPTLENPTATVRQITASLQMINKATWDALQKITKEQSEKGNQ